MAWSRECSQTTLLNVDTLSCTLSEWSSGDCAGVFGDSSVPLVKKEWSLNRNLSWVGRSTKWLSSYKHLPSSLVLRIATWYSRICGCLSYTLGLLRSAIRIRPLFCPSIHRWSPDACDSSPKVCPQLYVWISVVYELLCYS